VINPHDANACNNLGNALLDLGRSAEAEEAYREAVKLRPDEASARYNLGNALFIEGKSGEAIAEYRQALRINPSHSKAHHTLADALLKSGRPAEALLEYREGLKINPADAGAWHNLGKLLYQQGSREEGIRDLEKALRLEPGRMETLNDLAWMLSTAPDDSLRDGRKSQELALQAENASGGADPAILDTLAAAYAETGDYSKALETAGKALALAKQQGNKTIVASLGEEIALYKAGKPCRDPK
jgi:spermidine synthase